MSEVRKKIAKESIEGAKSSRPSGLIGYVKAYYGNESALPKVKRHTADVVVQSGRHNQTYLNVPCFVYSPGILDRGLAPNDRVWVQFIDGDPKLPIITAFYREPSQIEQFFEDMKYSVANFFGSLF